MAFKLGKVLTHGSSGVIANVDTVLAKTVLASTQTLEEAKGDILMGAIGVGMMVGVKMLNENAEFIAQAIPDQLDITDVTDAAKYVGGALTAVALLGISNKFGENYDNLSQIDQLNDEEFEEYLSTGKVKKNTEIENAEIIN